MNQNDLAAQAGFYFDPDHYQNYADYHHFVEEQIYDINQQMLMGYSVRGDPGPGE
jgi:hypothetical protein